MSADNGNTVNYTTKELIARVELKVDEVLVALATKADKSQVEVLERRIATLEMIGSPHVNKLQLAVDALVQRVTNLESFKQAVDSSKANRRWLIGLAIGNAGVWITIILKIFRIL